MTTMSATRAPWFEKYKVNVPEGSRGHWRVERFAIGEFDLERLRMNRDGRGCPPGVYTRLLRRNSIVMSDTAAEINDHLDFIHKATGRVLIHGLGIGMCIKAVLAKPEVTHVDVVEIDADLIALVGPHYECDRLTIHHADAMKKTWPTSVRWSAVWHDIWDGICADNLPDMKTLHRRYGRRCDWQGSWAREWIR